MKHIEECIEKNRKEEVMGLPIGMKYLNEQMGGLYPGEMTVICGDANDGKTALMIRMIHRLAIEEEIPVLIILNGMSERTLLACMTAFYCSIITKDIYEVFTHPTSKNDVEAYWNLLEKKPLYLAHSIEFVENGMESLKQFVSDKGIKAVFVEQISWEDNFGWKISELISLKMLADDLQIAVVAEHQIWWTEDNSLTLDCFGNKDLAALADNVIGLIDCANHGVYVDEKGEDIRGIIRLKIMKHKGVVTEGQSVIFRKIQLFCRDKKRATLYEAKER